MKTKTLLVCSYLVCLFVPSLRALGQATGGLVDPGGTGNGAPLTVTISVKPSLDLPMGWPIVLEAKPNVLVLPSWRWSATCNNLIWRTDASWDCATGGNQNLLTNWGHLRIGDFNSQATKTLYRIDYNLGAPLATETVTHHPPNQAKTVPTEATASPSAILPVTSPTPKAPTTVYQVMWTTLSWNGTNLGPCAELCYFENIATLPVHQDFTHSYQLQIAKFPTTCMQKVYGKSDDPGQITGNWNSPRLMDLLWQPLTYKDFQKIQKLADGTVLGKRTHTYTFEGQWCHPILKDWTFVTSIELESRVTSYKGVKIPKWVVVAQTP